MININSEVTQGIQKAIKRQGTPEYKVSDTIIPTIEVNPQIIKNVVIANVDTGTSGATTIIASDPNRDIYITSVSLSIIKDVTCDIATGSVNVNSTFLGALKNIIGLPVISLTAQNQSISVSFPHPLKIDRNAGVSISGTHAAGVLRRNVVVSYFVDETAGY
jgi:hypothetical protein